MNYLIPGAILGVGISQYISDTNFDIMYSYLIRPHAQFRLNKKHKYAADNGMDPQDYINYIKDTTYSFYNLIHWYTIGERASIRKYKRELCFDLIEKFEFVKETVENFDYVIGNIIEVVREDAIIEPKEGSYAFYAQLEREMKIKNKTQDEFSIENIQMIKEMTSDDYEKYLIDNSIVSKEDYLKSLTPEFRLSKETNKMRMIEQYHDRVLKYKNEKMGDDLDSKRLEVRNKATEVMNKTHLDDEEALIRLKEEKNQRKIKEIPDITKKYPSIKNVDGEIETLKQLFGEK